MTQTDFHIKHKVTMFARTAYKSYSYETSAQSSQSHGRMKSAVQQPHGIFNIEGGHTGLRLTPYHESYDVLLSDSINYKSK